MEEERYPSLPWQGWKIVKKLGRGGYGCVYQAQRNSAGVMEDAAIKVISFPKDKEDIEADFTDGYDMMERKHALRIAPCFALSQFCPVFAYREADASLLCSYRGGS